MNPRHFDQWIAAYPEFPKPAVVYWDFTPLLLNPHAFTEAIAAIRQHFASHAVSKIAAVEAKGFVMGSALAYDARLPLVLIRKPELMPGKVESRQFVKEYGTGEYQLRCEQLNSADRVLILYDIMAGAGASRAAVDLVRASGAHVVGLAYIIELEYLCGRELLPELELFSLVKIKSKPSAVTAGGRLNEIQTS